MKKLKGLLFLYLLTSSFAVFAQRTLDEISISEFQAQGFASKEVFLSEFTLCVGILEKLKKESKCVSAKCLDNNAKWLEKNCGTVSQAAYVFFGKSKKVAISANDRSVAIAAGSYYFAIASANEISKTECGEGMNLDGYWRDRNKARLEICTKVSADACTEFTNQEDQLFFSMRDGISDFVKNFESIEKTKGCEAAVAYFIKIFDAQVKAWQAIK